MKDKLNIGCGNDIRDGYVNLDMYPLPGVDVVHDLLVIPLPFEDKQFSEVVCKDVLEHLEYGGLMADIYRVMKPGASLYIRVPHFTSRDNYLDPTHKKKFSFRALEFFVKGSKFGREYYFGFQGYSTIKTELTFKKGLMFWNYLVEALVNSSFTAKSIYELTILCYMFPARNINIVLNK